MGTTSRIYCENCDQHDSSVQLVVRQQLQAEPSIAARRSRIHFTAFRRIQERHAELSPRVALFLSVFLAAGQFLHRAQEETQGAGLPRKVKRWSYMPGRCCDSPFNGSAKPPSR